MPSADNKRIAKNTMFLYFRMILIMGITLYTSRVVLNRLGVNDYGLYNVVGGIVTLFSLFSSALTGAITRFLTFELGKKDGQVQRIFAASITILLLVGLLVSILVETGGIWFVNNKMQIAPGRISAAHVVLQCSIITFVVNILAIPYNALILAHEKMAAFAYISLIEASLKLGIAFFLYLNLFDNLKTYAILMAVVAILVRWCYSFYSSHHFSEGNFEIRFDKEIFRKILSFTGWTCIGGSASILNGQGVNMLLNVYWGTVVNAARGLAVQVNTAVGQFSSNFMAAVNPQIIKKYAGGNEAGMISLVYQSSKYAFLLMYIIALPILIETESILRIWLGNYPKYTTIFIRLVLIQSLIESLCLSLQTANQAIGKVKWYQIIAGGILMLNFPISWVGLHFGLSPVWVYIVGIAISILGVFARLLVMRHISAISIRMFLKKVIFSCVLVGIISAVIPLASLFYLRQYTYSFIFNIALSILSVCITVWLIGIGPEEKILISSKIKSILNFKNANTCK